MDELLQSLAADRRVWHEQLAGIVASWRPEQAMANAMEGMLAQLRAMYPQPLDEDDEI